MSTFNKQDQEKYRQQFIEEGRSKAWSAACHAAWVTDQTDKLLKAYEKMDVDQRALDEKERGLELAIDSHTKDNRIMRKSLHEQGNIIRIKMKSIGDELQKSYTFASQLLGNIDSNLAVAEFAKTWIWKEVESKPVEEGIKKNDQQI